MKIFTDKKVKFLFLRMALYTLIFALFSISLIIFKLNNAEIYITSSSLLMFLVVFADCCIYFKKQNQIIENAEMQIIKYISGDETARIECDNEGELYKLFHKINSLASTLNAHAENELKSKEFLKNTISDISHQLKTPLTALNIYNGIIQNETKNLPEIQKFTVLTEQELDRIETLVQNLLKITKLDAGTIIIDNSEENLSDIIQTVKKHFSFRAEQEEKQIILSGNDSINLLCDRLWLTEALDNIVKNALDHTAKSGIIQIEYRQFASVVQVIIKDNGSGIHPEDLHHIFKRFYRSRFSKDTQGVGLGLPLAKAIIEAHNGTVEVDSEPNKGTVFTINFITANPTKL